jgi:hypothetical protein
MGYGSLWDFVYMPEGFLREHHVCSTVAANKNLMPWNLHQRSLSPTSKHGPAECHNCSFMQTGIAVVVFFVMFWFLTNRCGKSIEKRDWGEAVSYFLLALGIILAIVKIIPT